MTHCATEPAPSGAAITDYARYMRTDDLLALQRRPQDCVHPDELLFQITHQSTELWLKLTAASVQRAAGHIAGGHPARATLLLQRAVLSLRLITDQLQMLRHLTPHDFQTIRGQLGNGSGFESPGWSRLRAATRDLGRRLDALLTAEQVDLVALYRDDPAAPLYQLAEAMIDLDERVALWRAEHYTVATRIIGHDVLGTQATPVDTLARLVGHRLYPRLWEVRTTLTRTGPRGHAEAARR